MALRRDVLAAIAAGCGAAILSGCPTPTETLVLIGGRRVEPAVIDRDPLALLPGGVIILMRVDAHALFATDMGPDVGRFIETLLPIGPESNFIASRDVSAATTGIYAMQGVDFCAVVQGNFDIEAIGRAADTRATTPQGVPLVKTRYAESDMYTAGNLGFVPLTRTTILTGNETGMRRALDRLRVTSDDPAAAASATIARSVQPWMLAHIETPSSAFGVAADLATQPAVQAAASTFSFLAGLQTLRVLGGFQPPGIRVQGTMSYKDEAAAEAGAASLRGLNNLGQFMSFMTTFGLGAPIPPFETTVQGKEVAVGMSVDARLVRALLGIAISVVKPK